MRKISVKYIWVNLLIIAAAGFMIYSNTIKSEFHFDDLTSIIIQPRITTFKTFSDVNYWVSISNRPVSELTFAVNYHFGHFNVIGYHLVNILLHVLNAWLVYLLILKLLSFRRLSDERITNNKYIIALFAALLFLVHPIQTQAVSYVVQRMTSLSALFYLTAVYLYILGRLEFVDKQRKFRSLILIFLACFSGLLGVLSKQDTITFPAAFILVDLFFIRDKNGKFCRKYLITIISILCLLVLAIFISGHVPTETDAISHKDYLLTQFRVIVKYIQLVFLPVSQNVDYDFKISSAFWNLPVLGSFLLILALIALSVMLYRKKRLISFGILWFFLTMSVSSSIFPIRDVIFEHRLYLPLMGFSIAVIYILVFLLIEKRRRLLLILLPLIILVYAAATYKRNYIWKSEYALWKDVVTKSPRKARPWCNLGYVVLNMDSLEQAKRYFEQSLQVDPHYPLALNNLGHTLQRKGDFQTALKYFLQAIEQAPNYTNALNNTGCTLIDLDRAMEAIYYFNRAIASNPSYERSYYNMSLAYIDLGDMNKAVDYLLDYLKRKPDDIEALNNLGKCYFDRGDYVDALPVYQKALKRAPNDFVIINNMGNAYYKLGNPQKAIECYERALKINPKYESARLNLARFNQSP
ncbi:MAG: tetratricopeptide repeat protein [Bacteroidetes bacterium]|nr:tetratricopeptide repeat protein [Bacteroidota bacterium]